VPVALAALAALISLGITGCAPVEPVAAPAALVAVDSGPPVITPWLTLTGGWRAPLATPPGSPIPAVPALPGQRLNFQLPVGVAARNDQLLIADAGWRQVFLYERARDQLLPLGPFATALAADHATSLQLGADGGAWIVDTAAARVIQIDRAGRVRRSFQDERNASRPVAVVVADVGGDVYVADSTDARVVVFEPFGRALRRFGADKLQSIAAMAGGPDGLYVVDRLAQQVVVFDWGGTVRRAFGEASLVQPRAIAVDRSGRVFVGDDADQTIKVFVAGERIARYGGSGSAPGRFARIDALAVDGNLLYVADSANARVQVLLISPASMK
jgi:hypothetical protein